MHFSIEHYFKRIWHSTFVLQPYKCTAEKVRDHQCNWNWRSENCRTSNANFKLIPLFLAATAKRYIFTIVNVVTFKPPKDGIRPQPPSCCSQTMPAESTLTFSHSSNGARGTMRYKSIWNNSARPDCALRSRVALVRRALHASRAPCAGARSLLPHSTFINKASV